MKYEKIYSAQKQDLNKSTSILFISDLSHELKVNFDF